MSGPAELPTGQPDHVAKVDAPELETVPREQLDAAIRELSKDIVTKAKQIEMLIDSMPALENVSSDLGAIEAQLEQARAEEAAAAAEREQLLGQVDELVMRVTAYKADVDKIVSGV